MSDVGTSPFDQHPFDFSPWWFWRRATPEQQQHQLELQRELAAGTFTVPTAPGFLRTLAAIHTEHPERGEGGYVAAHASPPGTGRGGRDCTLKAVPGARRG